MNQQEFEDASRRYREEMFRMYAAQQPNPRPAPRPAPPPPPRPAPPPPPPRPEPRPTPPPPPPRPEPRPTPPPPPPRPEPRPVPPPPPRPEPRPAPPFPPQRPEPRPAPSPPRPVLPLPFPLAIPVSTQPDEPFSGDETPYTEPPAAPEYTEPAPEEPLPPECPDGEPDSCILPPAPVSEDDLYDNPAEPPAEEPEPTDTPGFEKRPHTGTIEVHVMTARGAKPVAGASVVITRMTGGEPHLISLQTSDESGSIRPVAVPAPPPSADQRHPAFYGYDISVQAGGYYRETSADVPVFPGVTSVQSFDMIPLPAGTDGTEPGMTFYNDMPRL